MASVQPLGIFGGAGGQAIAQELARRKEQDTSNQLTETLTKLMEQQSLSDYRGQLGAAQRTTANAAAAKQGGLNTLADTLAAQYPDDPSLPAAVRGQVLDGASYNTAIANKQMQAGALKLFEPFAADDEYSDVVGQLTPDQMTGLVQATQGDVTKIATALENTRNMAVNQLFDKPENQDAAIQITDKIQEMVNPSNPWARVQMDVKKVKPEDLPNLATKEVFSSELFKSAPPELQQVLMREYSKRGVDGLNSLSETQWKRISEREKLDMEAAKTQSTLAKDKAGIKLTEARTASEPIKAAASMISAKKPPGRGGGAGGPVSKTQKQVEDLTEEYFKLQEELASKQSSRDRKNKAAVPYIQEQLRQKEQQIRIRGGSVGSSAPAKPAGGGYAGFVKSKFGL